MILNLINKLLKNSYKYNLTNLLQNTTAMSLNEETIILRMQTWTQNKTKAKIFLKGANQLIKRDDMNSTLRNICNLNPAIASKIAELMADGTMNTEDWKTQIQRLQDQIQDQMRANMGNNILDLVKSSQFMDIQKPPVRIYKGTDKNQTTEKDLEEFKTKLKGMDMTKIIQMKALPLVSNTQILNGILTFQVSSTLPIKTQIEAHLSKSIKGNVLMTFEESRI